MARELNIPEEQVFIEDSYFGQTITEGRARMNGHRSAFKQDQLGNFPEHSKSALAQHCYDQHQHDMDMKNFKIGFVKRCKITELDREEAKFISRYRTEISGLNRMKVIR